MRGALMVCGTGRDVGKSHLVAGLCRAGHEIGRPQAVQAFASGVDPDVLMNPILLKSASATSSQVVVLGKPIGHLDAADYHHRKLDLLDTVLDCLSTVRSKYEVVLLLEGAMSSDGRVFGTSPHGLFESDGCRRAFLAEVGRHRGRAFVPGRTCFADAGQPRLGRLGDLVDEHLAVGGVEDLIRTAA